MEIYMESIGRKMKEYLVNMTLLEQKLKMFNIIIEDNLTMPFKTLYSTYLTSSQKKLTENEETYSFLNIAFTFRKLNPEQQKQRPKLILKTNPSSSDVSLPNLGFMNYNNNSCYLDSTLMTLLHYIPNEWLLYRLFKARVKTYDDKNIMESAKTIRKYLSTLNSNIHNISENNNSLSSDKLRNSFNDFDLLYCKEYHDSDCNGRNWKNAQQDYREVLTILGRAFKLSDCITVSTNVVKTNKKNDIIEEFQLKSTFDFDYLIIKPFEHPSEQIQLRDFCPIFTEVLKPEDNPITTTKTSRIIKAECIFIKILRAHYDDKSNEIKNTKTVLLEDEIKINDRNQKSGIGFIMTY